MRPAPAQHGACPDARNAPGAHACALCLAILHARARRPGGWQRGTSDSVAARAHDATVSAARGAPQCGGAT